MTANWTLLWRLTRRGPPSLPPASRHPSSCSPRTTTLSSLGMRGGIILKTLDNLCNPTLLSHSARSSLHEKIRIFLATLKHLLRILRNVIEYFDYKYPIIWLSNFSIPFYLKTQCWFYTFRYIESKKTNKVSFDWIIRQKVESNNKIYGWRHYYTNRPTEVRDAVDLKDVSHFETKLIKLTDHDHLIDYISWHHLFIHW